MKPLMKLRLVLDALAAALLLICFAYWWLGGGVLEAAGTILFLLLILHAVFNRTWFRRVSQTRHVINVAVTFALLVAILVVLATSLLISNSLATWMPDWGVPTARQAHILAAYWVLLLVGAHLGLRWPLLSGFARAAFGISTPNRLRTWVLRALAAGVSAYGLGSFTALGIGNRLTMRMTLDWWNFEESVLGFFVHGLALVVLVACLTHAVTSLLQQAGRPKGGTTVKGATG